MTKSINVIIVEDEPLMSHSLVTGFENYSSSTKVNFNIVSKINYEQATSFFKVSYNTDYALNILLLSLDIQINESLKINATEDTVKKFKAIYKNSKIILTSRSCSNFKINSILNTINPDCFLIKNDIDFEEFQLVIKRTLSNTPYYSVSILKQIKRHFNTDYVLDKTDKKILYYISQGLKTKDLPKLVNLSISAIERRKRILKDHFVANERDDISLLKAVREQGII